MGRLAAQSHRTFRRLAVAMSALLLLAMPVVASERVLHPTDDVQAVVDASPPGTAFIFSPGTYRMQSIFPKDGDVFDGQGHAILNGSRLLDKFERHGRLWVASGQNQKGYVLKARACQQGFARCSRPEDLYVDDKPLRHVDGLFKVGKESWYFDYAAGEVYLGDDPAGRKIEIGVTPLAFGGRAVNVAIRNLTIEKYASPLSTVDTERGRAWTVETNIIRLNHSVGVTAGHGSKVVRNRLLQNGQQGFDGGGDDFLIEANEVAGNNYAGVSIEWEAGGGKVAQSGRGAVIRGNCVHGNDGPGIWADENVRGLVIENNVVFDNSAAGIMYEISFDGTIRNNRVAGNGAKTSQWFWGPQILISGSSDVQVYRNVIDVSANYGNAITIVAQNRSPYPPASDNRIFENTIVMRGTDARMGAVTDVAAYVTTVATKNSMYANAYHVADLGTAFWHWNNRDLDWTGIEGEGQERGSTIDNHLPPKQALDCKFLGLN